MTILILEDEPSVMNFTRAVLTPLGHTILEATTAEEAFRRFEETEGGIDLLIADATLPVSSGIRVALELRSLLPYLRIILTSGYPPYMWNEQDAAELLELPSDSVATLEKPWVPALLRQTVARFVGISSTVTALRKKAAED
ncbi:MAG: response regulator [Bryobacteraceae bacterium]